MSNEVFKTISKFLSKHSHDILVGTGIAGLIGAVIATGVGTAKAINKVEEKKKELKVEKLTAAQTVKETWTCYIPAASFTVMSVASILGANKIQAKHIAALSSAYTMSEGLRKDLKEQIKESLGEKKATEIEDKVAEKQVQKNPPAPSVILTGSGDVTCYEPITGRYFKSNADKIRRAEISFNRLLFNEQYASLNDFLYLLGVDQCDIGSELGWMEDGREFEIRLTSMLYQEEPILVLNYDSNPVRDYNVFG